MSRRKTRIAVLNSHPIQYYAPLYAHLCRDQTLEITALYCSDFSLRNGLDSGFGRRITWDVDLLSGYPSVFLGARARLRTPRGYFSLVCPEVWTEVRSGKYDVLWLHGYSYAADLIAFLAAKSKGIPVLMRSDTHLRLARSRWRQWLRHLVLSTAYRFVDGFLAVGIRNVEYYRSLGISSERIFLVPFTVDNARFMRRINDVDERSTIRRTFGIRDDEVVVLFASKLTPRKRAADLLRAMAVLHSHGVSATLLIVGSGESQCDLVALSRELRLTRVIFGGFVNQSSLPGVLQSADVFVLPSESEPWGLVVNEAMCAGLPIVVTHDVGAASDLVHEGKNGYVVSVGDIEALAAALESLVSDEAKRKRMGAASVETIRTWNYDLCLSGVQAALAKLSSTCRTGT